MSATKNRSSSIYDLLSSVRFAIVILSLIALGSVFGTLIRQGASAEEYLSLYSPGVYKIISFAGFDDVYHSYWFYALLALFGVNLFLCTLKRFKRYLSTEKNASLPGEETLSSMPFHFRTPGKTPEEAAAVVGKRFRTLYSDDQGVIMEKGGLSRYGVYLIHISVLVILLGSFVGLMAGKKGFMILWKGDSKDRMTLRGMDRQESPLGFTLKCKDFSISFYDSGEPKDYVSSVEVMEGGKTVMEQDVRVNHPLFYKGFRVYQSSYGSAPLFRFTIGGEPVTLREGEVFNKGRLTVMAARFRENIHSMGPGVLLAFLDEEETKGQWFLENVEDMREGRILGVPVRLEDIGHDYYTGLEIAKDPGVWIVWTGFATILLGLYINFFLFRRRLYIRKTGDGVIVAAVAGRNKEGFSGEFDRLRRSLNGD